MEALSIHNLHKTYASGVKAVNGVDLVVQQGDFFALLGPNGAGKSTIIGIISSLVNKTAGQVKVCGHDLDKDLVAAKACMGLVPQEINFNQFEDVEDIVINQAGYYGMPYNIAKVRAEKYLRQLGLWEKRNSMSRTLSGGMKRRLMIARALVHEPKILILDEPTAGVDIELRRSTWEFLQQINQAGTTIILTTHYLEEAEFLCKRIAIIDKGVILENTSIKQFLGQLQNETFILDLKDHITADQLPTTNQMQFSLIDSLTLEVIIPRSMSINALFADLSNAKIQVMSLRNKANRLEELFLNLIQTNHAQDIS